MLQPLNLANMQSKFQETDFFFYNFFHIVKRKRHNNVHDLKVLLINMLSELLSTKIYNKIPVINTVLY